MTLDDFQAMIINELGVAPEDIKMQFKDNSLSIDIANVDEDMFDEDQDIGDLEEEEK